MFILKIIILEPITVNSYVKRVVWLFLSIIDYIYQILILLNIVTNKI